MILLPTPNLIFADLVYVAARLYFHRLFLRTLIQGFFSDIPAARKVSFLSTKLWQFLTVFVWPANVQTFLPIRRSQTPTYIHMHDRNWLRSWLSHLKVPDTLVNKLYKLSR